MAFIKNNESKIGQRVILTQDVKVLSGTFERGTKMTITGNGFRGLDLVDDYGNNLRETGLLGNFYRPE